MTAQYLGGRPFNVFLRFFSRFSFASRMTDYADEGLRVVLSASDLSGIDETHVKAAPEETIIS